MPQRNPRGSPPLLHHLPPTYEAALVRPGLVLSISHVLAIAEDNTPLNASLPTTLMHVNWHLLQCYKKMKGPIMQPYEPNLPQVQSDVQH